MVEADYCKSCHYFLREYNSCPRAFVFEEGYMLPMILEVIWALASIASYIAFLIIVGYSFYQRTYRGFCIATLLGGQHVLCLILKEIYVQARPEGACATSFGFPSSHSSFVAALLTWLIIERVCFHSKSSFKAWKYYSLWRNILIPSAVIVPIARFILNYHTLSQVFSGIFLGIFCAVGYYVVIVRPIMLKKHQTFINEIMLKIWQLLGLKDNLTHEDIANTSEAKEKKNI